MTKNKRYSDGSLAKWYYSRDYNGMRVISNGVDEFTVHSKKPFIDINSKELKGTNQLLDELNNLEDKIIILEKENKELKKELDYYKNQHIDENVKWLRENTVWEQMPTSTRTITQTSITSKKYANKTK